MVRGISGISIPDLSFYGSHGSKMSLPVDPSSLVYSHFKHVSGMLAPKGTQGISISKLNLLDALITQINQVNKNGASLASGVKDSGVDSVIENLANQVKQAKNDNAAMPYTPSPAAQSGVVFSLST